MNFMEKVGDYQKVEVCIECGSVGTRHYGMCQSCGFEGRGPKVTRDAYTLWGSAYLVEEYAEKPYRAEVMRPVWRRQFPAFWRWRLARWEPRKTVPDSDVVDVLIREVSRGR